MKNHLPIKSCPQKWDEMIIIEQSSDRFCKKCDKRIFDITKLNDDESFKLKEDNNSICVIAEIQQIKRLRKIQKNEKNNVFLKKVGLIGLLVISNLINEGVLAQTSNEKNIHKIEQSDTSEDSFVLKGKIVIANKYKDNESVARIEIYSEDGILISSLLTDKNGKFNIKLSKSDLKEKYSIKISRRNFISKEIKDLKPKNTKLRIRLIKSKLSSPGFF